MGARKQLTFKASMGCGDMIYSLCIVKAICEKENAIGVYYIEQSKYTSLDTYQACKRLFEHQDYIQSCERYEKQRIDYDFDRARPIDTQKPIISQFADLFGVELPSISWLKQYGKYDYTKKRYCCITSRYNKFNKEAVKYHLKYCDEFIGLDSEFTKFKSDYNMQNITHSKTKDLFDVFKLIQFCRYVVCNQTAILAIAQGKRKTVYLAKDERFNNTLGAYTYII